MAVVVAVILAVVVVVRLSTLTRKRPASSRDPKSGPGSYGIALGIEPHVRRFGSSTAERGYTYAAERVSVFIRAGEIAEAVAMSVRCRTLGSPLASASTLTKICTSA